MRVLNLKKLFLKISMLTLLFSFLSNAARAGGDVYEVHLNNKLILKQFVIEPFKLQNLHLNNAKPTDQLIVTYTHCGVIGKGRTIAIKDERGVILKEWKFKDAPESAKGMMIKVEEILALQKKAGNKGLTLYYTANEMPEGRTLAFMNGGVRSGV